MSLQDVIDVSNSFYAEDAYDRTKTPRRIRVRYMRPDEARALQYGAHILFVGGESPIQKVRRLKVNGAPRTWKRTPERVEVPCKYGLRDCATFEAREGRMHYYGSALVVEVNENA